MELQQEILSDVTVHMKYAKFIEEKQRRETWEEICNRNMDMHLTHVMNNESISQENRETLCDMITDAYSNHVMKKKVLPSMRSMQFAGKPIELSPNRVYNCAYMPIDSYLSFSEAMFLLLGGTGVGYSVQRHHVEKLPEIRLPNPKRTYRHLIADSIEGWADAVKVLFESYIGKRSTTVRFDYSDIRPKGSLLKTSGGKAPGPQPLRECLVKVEGILSNKNNGDYLTTLEAHDIVCHIADAVLAGGIRRAALISLFSADDDEMITSKSGHFWEKNPQRARANNSVVLLRHRITRDVFNNLWKRVQESGSGEPGFYFSNDKDWGTNPCCEIALRPYQFCNLTEINASTVASQEELNKRVEIATLLGTLQASYTDFHYLREVWQRTSEKDALLGVSMTGIASNRVLDLDLEKAATVARRTNTKIASLLGIKPSARITCVKPAGTTSLVLGSSSGIHAWFSRYYIRRVRVLKTEAIYEYLVTKLPDLVEDDYFNPNQAIISIPQKTPSGNVITRDESALEMLERVKRFSVDWVMPGHVRGMNTHNVSATVNIREDEWEDVRNWMWKNRDFYNGLSVLPYDGGVYKQAPFEEITKKQYESMFDSLKNIDLSQIVETMDNTNLQGELACAGGVCEI
jgi:ribonucleoside-diphosphate reductase alpha chain|tara:strand:- start:4087 stop:5979 length:1893 start_codon:yes stop_codon:yes gene_type:complete